MAGMRAATRGPAPSERASTLLRACLDLVEPVRGQPRRTSRRCDVETTLGVLDQAIRDLETTSSGAASTALSCGSSIHTDRRPPSASRGPPISWPLAYALIAMPADPRCGPICRRYRYRWFGKRETCMIPTPDLRERFLDG